MKLRAASLVLLFASLALAPAAAGYLSGGRERPIAQLRTVTLPDLAASGLIVEDPVDTVTPDWSRSAEDRGIPHSWLSRFDQHLIPRPRVDARTARQLVERVLPPPDAVIEMTLAYVTDNHARLGPCPPGHRFCAGIFPIGDRQLSWVVVTGYRQPAAQPRTIFVVGAETGQLAGQVGL